MSGFQSPNYTQTPNDLFDVLLPDMGYAELKVTLCILRNTLGYHREGVSLSIRAISRMTGLTPRNVLEGAKVAETRGTITRTVSSTMTTTWLAVIAGDTPCIPKGYRTVSPTRKEVPVKESKEREIKKNEDDEALAKISRAYQSEIGMLTPMIADELREASTAYPVQWTLDAIHEASIQNKRGWKYVLAILTRWKAQGNQEAMNKPQGSSNFKPRDLIKERYGGIMEWIKEAEENDNTTDSRIDNGKSGGGFPQLEAR